jgi:carbamoyltransferase
MRILGISPYHDSSVCVLNNNKIELFLKEERLSNVKRDMYPWKSINYVLKQYGNTIDHIILASPYISEYNNFIFKYLEKSFDAQVMDMSGQHHMQHASLAFYNSGFDKAVVLVIDRNGSFFEDVGYEAESVFLASYPHMFKELYKTFAKDNELGIVKVYESATTLIGQHPLENGKTMGLSSYGNEVDSILLFDKDGIPKDNLFDGVVVDGFGHNKAMILKQHKHKIVNSVSKENYQEYANHSSLVQRQTQKEVLKLIKEFSKSTGIKNICITGGYGLNVVANNYYLENCEDLNFYFEPLADDSGNSIGAAMFLYRELTGDETISPISNTFFHGSHHNVNIDKDKISYKDVVNVLNAGKTVGVFGGLAEGGPRALGNRSILFDPRVLNGKDIVNKIKNREWYRPFGAVMLQEDFEENFYTNGYNKNDYMTVAYKAKDGVNLKIPSVIHVDNTCRIQTVSGGHIYELLKEFKKETGIGILLNTSLNIAGQPLIETPEQALDMLKLTSLDHIWFYEKNILETRV